jgi:hypothetical protein
MDEKLFLKIHYEYGLFYDLINSLIMPAMRDYQERFKDYQSDLYDAEQSDRYNDAELKLNSLLHLVNDFLYDAERLTSKE